MHNVSPSVFLIAKTQVLPGARDWLDSIGAEKYQLAEDRTPGEQLVMLAGKRCYKAFVPLLNPNVTKVRDDATEYIDNILKSGHGSVMEHVTFTFAIENISRVFTGEMNRHRAGMAISEGSMRYIRYDDIPFWIPTSLQESADDSPGLTQKKRASREVMRGTFQLVEDAYKRLVDIWKDELSETSKFKYKKQITSMMRRIIPMGIATGGVWSGNLRALRHIFNLRCSAAAEEEILLVATAMLKIMQAEEPTIFKDFQIVNGYWTPKYLKV
jgi:thymidylate synthase (FAD)